MIPHQPWSRGAPVARLPSLTAAADADDARFGDDRDRAYWLPPTQLKGAWQFRSINHAAMVNERRRSREARCGMKGRAA